MKRLRSLGVAAVAALCLAAIPASASAAGGFVADSVYANLQGAGSPPSAHTLTFTVGSSSMPCNKAYGNATLEGPSDFIAISESLTCSGGGFAEPELKMNGCKFILHPGSSSFDIGPAGCGQIEGSLLGYQCPFALYPQTGLKATYENTGSGSSAAVNIALKGSNAEFSFLTNGICGTKGKQKGMDIVTSGWTEGATTGWGNPTGLYSSAGSLPAGVYLTEGGYLVTQLFPGIITGTLETSPATVFTAKSASSPMAACTGGTFSSELAEPTHTEVPFSASYTGCSGVFGKVTMIMNSCRYTLGEFKFTGTAYKGQAGIGCTKAGDTITVEAPGCSVAIPAQALGSEAAEPKNVGQGVHATLSARLTASNVKYTATGGLCVLGGFKVGAQTDGIVDTRISLSAVLSESIIKHG